MRMNVANPLSARRPRGGESPAKTIWGADFELWGPDCPLEPGVWRDRIGGLEVECVGSGDWFRDADGYVGVSKADVCWAEWSAASGVDAKVCLTHFTAARTLVIVAKDYVGPDGKWVPLISYRSGTGDYHLAYRASHLSQNVAEMAYYASNGIDMRTYGRPYVADSTKPPTIFAQYAYRDPAGVNRLTKRGLTANNNATWTAEQVNVSSAYHAGVLSNRRILSRALNIGGSWIDRTAARSTAILSIAGCEGLPDPQLLKDWTATLPGVTWP